MVNLIGHRPAGQLIAIADFRARVAAGELTSANGAGFFATAEHESDAPVDVGDIQPGLFSHVKWYGQG